MNLFARELRDLAFVPRWGIARTIHTQSVAEHSYYVACYAKEIMKAIKWGRYWEQGLLIIACLEHDIEESFMSDIPGPSKRSVVDKEKYNNYTEIEVAKRFGQTIHQDAEIKAIIKVADLVDECMFLGGELQMGNRSILKFYGSARERLFKATQLLPTDHSDIKILEDDLKTAIDRQLNGYSKPPRNNSDVAS